MWPRNAQRLALNSVLICLGSTILLLAPCDASTEGAALTQGLVFPDGYNRNVPPAGKTLIRVAFEIEDISEISDNDISVTFKLVTTMNWNDSRLGVDERVFQQLEVEDRWYTLSTSQCEGVWQPRMDFLHLKRQSPITEGLQTHDCLLTTYPDFRLYYSDAASTTVNCHMDFSRFPFDHHICYFEATTLAPIEETELIYFERNGTPTWGRADTTTALQYEVTFSDIPESRKRREYEFFSEFKPTLSYAGFQLQLRRKSTPYIFNYYLPSAMFVVVSWASFAIPVGAIPGRVALLITTFLSLANIVNSAFANSPHNQGINYMQLWIVSCIGFVFLAILEYVTLLCQSRFSSKGQACAGIFPRLRSAKDIDRHFLYLCPTLFVIFGIFYWANILI